MKKDCFQITSDITIFLLLWLPIIGIGFMMVNYAIAHGAFLLSLFVFSFLAAIWAMIANALAPLAFIISFSILGLLLLGKKMLTGLFRKFA